MSYCATFTFSVPPIPDKTTSVLADSISFGFTTPLECFEAAVYTATTSTGADLPTFITFNPTTT